MDMADLEEFEQLSGELEVKYTVKELLGNLQKGQDVGFAEVKTSLNSKAEKTDLEPIHRRLDEHGRDIGFLKDRVKEDEAITGALTGAKTRMAGFWWKVLSAAGGVPLAILSILEILSLIHHK